VGVRAEGRHDRKLTDDDLRPGRLQDPLICG
jgi:hypothetical protein